MILHHLFHTHMHVPTTQYLFVPLLHCSIVTRVHMFPCTLLYSSSFGSFHLVHSLLVQILVHSYNTYCYTSKCIPMAHTVASIQAAIAQSKVNENLATKACICVIDTLIPWYWAFPSQEHTTRWDESREKACQGWSCCRQRQIKSVNGPKWLPHQSEHC